MTKVGFVSYTFEVGDEFIELYRLVEEQEVTWSLKNKS